MATIEQIAQAALDGEALAARSLTMDFLRENPDITAVSRPDTTDERLLSATAALLELLAQRQRQQPPTWTQAVGAVSPPVYLLKSAAKMRRLREMCQREAPEPLRKRGFYAPANYLEFV
jgi:hypothetical protein